MSLHTSPVPGLYMLVAPLANWVCAAYAVTAIGCIILQSSGGQKGDGRPPGGNWGLQKIEEMVRKLIIIIISNRIKLSFNRCQIQCNYCLILIITYVVESYNLKYLIYPCLLNCSNQLNFYVFNKRKAIFLKFQQNPFQTFENCIFCCWLAFVGNPE